MPITIDNGLLNSAVDLGTGQKHNGTNPTPELLALLDTCGSLNTGYLPFHLWIRSLHPDTVAAFRSFDNDDPFEPVKLLGAITDPTTFDSSLHGTLTALIRYHTPYTDLAGNPVLLSFALGNDVSTNTIIGLPTIDAFDFLIDVRNNTAHSRSCDLTFPIICQSSNLGLPPGIDFCPEDIKRCSTATTTAPTTNSPTTIFPSTSSMGVDDYSQGYLRRHLSTPDL
jgi:hypothetical protein